MRLALHFALAALMMAAACTPSAASGGAGDAGLGEGGRIGDGGDAGVGKASVAALEAGALDDSTIPPTSSDDLNARARHLLEAIAAGNSELAVDMLFPRDGYIASRDTSDATKLWDKKVSLPFKKHIGSLHKRKSIDRAQFVGIELGHSVSQITPKRHDWKKPLWRVKGSHLAYIVDGKTIKIPIAEMVAWRGAWYVTRMR